MTPTDLLIVILILSMGHILAQCLFMLERRRYLKMIEDLTDKIMAKNYTDYTYGQAVKNDEPEETEHRDRSDGAEAMIEHANRVAAGLEEEVPTLGKKIDDMMNVGA